MRLNPNATIMTKQTARRRSCCRGKSGTRKRCRVELAAIAGADRSKKAQAMPKPSTNRRSGCGRCAGLERSAARRDKNSRYAIELLDRVRGGRQRQRRRGGGERIAEQRDVRHRRGNSRRRACKSVNIVVVDVAKRENKLHRQRKERQPAAQNPVRPEPPHHANSGFIAHSRRCRSVYDAAAGAQRHNNFPQAGPERLMRAVALMRQSRRNKRACCAGPMSKHQHDTNPPQRRSPLPDLPAAS
jgi:hypothetical protein